MRSGPPTITNKLPLALSSFSMRFRVDGRKRFEYATCGCVFFWKRRKKSPFSKISRYVWTGPEYNMTQRKACVTCQRKPFGMLINGLGAVFQENYHLNFAESIIFCFPYDLVTRRWWKIISSSFMFLSELFNKARTSSVVMCEKTILYKGYVKCISLFSRK